MSTDWSVPKLLKTKNVLIHSSLSILPKKTLKHKQKICVKRSFCLNDQEFWKNSTETITLMVKYGDRERETNTHEHREYHNTPFTLPMG